MPTLATLHDERQDRLLARADRTADQAEAVVRQVWLDLLRAIDAGGPYFVVHRRVAAILRNLPEAARLVAEDLVGVAQDSARWTAHAIARTLEPAHVRRLIARRGPRLEADPFPIHLPDLDDLQRFILPTLTGQQVSDVLRAYGWEDRLRRLTKLADPDALASRIASLVMQGQTTQTIAREIRPLVQGVQTSARRVARTAGLWIAHEAELATYDGLGTLVAGYQIHAVLDHATRPEHRKRDGTRYWRRPGPGQKGIEEMPRPPREADGSWAYNCRCFLSPILGEG